MVERIVTSITLIYNYAKRAYKIEHVRKEINKMKIVSWIGKFFEDQNGNPSSKRATLYVCLFFLWMIIRGSLEGKTVDQMVLFSVCGIVLFSIGAVTSEFFKKFPIK